MIKKISCILLTFLVLFAFSACSGGNQKDESTGADNTVQNTSEQTQPQNSSDEKQNILVVYFSATGTTEKIAKTVSEALRADIYEITPEKPYTDEDLAYYTDCRADREQKDSSARPAISGKVDAFDKYDTIILGYPIWHGQAPRIISTFMESYDFSGKTIIPFCTSHSSGLGSSDKNLHSLCSSSAKWMDGKDFYSNTSDDEIQQWIADTVK